MSVEFAAERRLLAEDEIGPVVSSHYPELDRMARDDLLGLARWLRSQHGRARDIIRARRRVRRGKAEPRGTATETASERGLAAKKQIFARGLKRVNGRLGQLRAEEKRAHAMANLRAALTRRQSATVHTPDPGRSAHGGMRARAGATRRGIVGGGRVGSVSQAGKNAQATRDSRG